MHSPIDLFVLWFFGCTGVLAAVVVPHATYSTELLVAVGLDAIACLATGEPANRAKLGEVWACEGVFAACSTCTVCASEDSANLYAILNVSLTAR